MRINSKLRRWPTLKVAFLCLTALALLCQPIEAQEANTDQEFAKLGGPSRKITGVTRSSGNSSASTQLPKSIILGHSNGKIKIQVSKEKVTSPDAISFQRSDDGEQWRVGNDEPNVAGASRALGGNAPASEVVSVATASVSMDQLLGQSVFRGKSFLTPAPNSRLLSRTFTIRRAVDGNNQLNADKIEIVSGNRVVLSFIFPEGTESIGWSNRRANSIPRKSAVNLIGYCARSLNGKVWGR